MMRPQSSPQPEEVALQDLRDQPLLDAQKYVEYDIFAYQMYAGLLQSHFDPYSLNFSNPGKMQEILKEQASWSSQTREERSLPALSRPPQATLDYMSYGSPADFDPERPVFYRDGVDTAQYIQPPEFTSKIGRIILPDGTQKEYPPKTDQDDSIDIYPFEGKTGVTKKQEGFSSPMGYVAYDRKTKEITVVFRGSRSGGGLAGTAASAAWSDAGSPDWVTDLQMTPEEFNELSPDGKFQPGFARTYLSCRPGIIEAIGKIKESDPDAEQTLVTTGHSLGGALATTMFMDAKVGTLRQKLAEKTGSEAYAEDLTTKSKCVAVSAPSVCTKAASAKLTVEDKANFRRVYFANDPIVLAPSMSAKLSREINALEFIQIPPGNDINLGVSSRGWVSDMDPSAHEPYLVHETLQKLRGIIPEQFKTYWLIFNNKLEVINAPYGVKKYASPQQAADIIEQFDVEYFLTSARLLAEAELKKNPQLQDAKDAIKIIEIVGDMFHDPKLDPYASEENFIKFKEKLSQVVNILQDIASIEPAAIARTTGVGYYSLDVLQEFGVAIKEIRDKVVTIYKNTPELKGYLAGIAPAYEAQYSELMDAFALLSQLKEGASLAEHKEALIKAKAGIEKFKNFLTSEQQNTKLPPVAQALLGSAATLVGDMEKFIGKYGEVILQEDEILADPEGNKEETKISLPTYKEFLGMAAQLMDGLRRFNNDIADIAYKESVAQSSWKKAGSKLSSIGGFSLQIASGISYGARSCVSKATDKVTPTPRQLLYKTCDELSTLYQGTAFEALSKQHNLRMKKEVVIPEQVEQAIPLPISIR